MDDTTITSIADSVDVNAIAQATVTDGIPSIPAQPVPVDPVALQAEIADFQTQVTTNTTQAAGYNSKATDLLAQNDVLNTKIAADQALLTQILAIPGVTQPTN